jgi:nucleoside-diphosphate-sugar epimerase
VIAATLAPAYRAAAQAGVRRFVFLSSASVHGQNPAPGTTEESPLHTDHALVYNNAKVRAERQLQALARGGAMEVSILRPGIVFGPRSRWIVEGAEALAAGTAGWSDGGRGVCNSIYVDNLAHAIERALETPGLRGEAFLVGDAETVPWREFYAPLAAALGRSERDFAELPPTWPSPPTLRDKLGALKATGVVQGLLPLFPGRLKETVKAALARWHAPPPPDPYVLPAAPSRPALTAEMSLLFACRVKLPHDKAARVLGYRPPVSFADGLAASVRWLAKAGYSVAAEKA